MTDTAEFARALYQGMPLQRSIDPESYDSKYNYWSQRILAQQNERKQPCFTLNELQSAFTSHNLVPLCLPAVLDRMMSEKRLVTKESDMDAALQQRTHTLTWKVARYLFSFARSPPGLGLHDTLIITDQLRKQSNAIWQLVRDQAISPTDWLITERDMRALYERAAVDAEKISWDALSHYMQLQNIIAPVYAPAAATRPRELAGYKFLPFVPGFAWDQPTKSPVNAPSQVDSHVLVLRRTIERAKKRVVQMEEKVGEAKQQALAASAKKQKKVALLYMKRYNGFQDRLVELVATAHKLEDLEMSIQSAETSVQLVDSYRHANSALSTIMQGVNVDQVDDIILTLEDSLENQQRIDSAMAFSDVDPGETDELEAELAQLMQEDAPVNVPVPVAAPTQPAVASLTSEEDNELNAMMAELSDLSVCSEPPAAATPASPQ